MQENSLEPLLKPLVRNMKGRHIAVGPICWLPKDGLKDKIWYFRTAVCDRRRGFVSDEVHSENRADIDALRNTILMGLMARKPPLIIHRFDDELDMVRFCETLWPGEKVTKIREAVERERAAWAAGIQGTA